MPTRSANSGEVVEWQASAEAIVLISLKEIRKAELIMENHIQAIILVNEAENKNLHFGENMNFVGDLKRVENKVAQEER